MRKLLGRTLVLFGLVLLLQPRLLAEDVTQTHTIGVKCTTSGQLCDPPYALDIETDGVLHLPGKAPASFSSRMTSLSSFSLTCPVSVWRTCHMFSEGLRGHL